jgi:translation initiation factor 2 subunit 1
VKNLSLKLPKRDEVVLCKITQIKKYGVYGELVSNPQIKTFTYINNVSSTWIKNIRNFVRIGQIRAGKVLNVKKDENLVELSFAKVTPSEEKEKINEWKNEKRMRKLIESYAKSKEKSAEILKKIEERYDNLAYCLEDIIKSPIEELGLEEWGIEKEFIDFIKNSVKKSNKEIKITLKLSFFDENGIDHIKEILTKIARMKEENVKIEIKYIGAPKYLLKIEAPDYKICEKVWKKAQDILEKETKKAKGEFSYERE